MGPYLEPLQDSDNLLCIRICLAIVIGRRTKSNQAKGFAKIGSNIIGPNEGGGQKD